MALLAFTLPPDSGEKISLGNILFIYLFIYLHAFICLLAHSLLNSFIDFAFEHAKIKYLIVQYCTE